MNRRRPLPPLPPLPPPPSTSSTSPNQTTPSNTTVNKQWTPQNLLTSSYKSLGTPNQVSSQFQEILLSNPKTLQSILSILLTEPGKTGIFDYSLQVDIHDFIVQDAVLGNMLLRFPMQLLPLLEEAIVNCQREIVSKWNDFEVLAKLIHFQGISDNSNRDERNGMTRLFTPLMKPVIKGENNTRVHARLIHLPPHSMNCKPSLSTLSSHDIGKILQLSGTVIRTSKIQMYESHRIYECDSGSTKKNGDGGCGCRFTIKADLQCWNNALEYPLRCPNVNCKNKSFKVISPLGGGGENGSWNRSDYQEIKVQETLNMIGGGIGGANGSGSRSGNGGTTTIPKTLLIKLQNDLVDTCQPGDDVVVVGTLISHWLGNLVHMSDVQIGMAMEAHSIRVVNGGSGNDNGGSSSWDCIFNSNGVTPSQEEDDDDVEEEHDNNNNDSMKKRRRMVRDDIVREFEDYWNEDMNKYHPIAARNFICKAVCPTLYGLSMVKISLLLVLIGGSNETFHTNSSGGGDSAVAGENENDTNGHSDTENDGNKEHNENRSEDEMQFPVQFSLNDFDNDNQDDKPLPQDQKRDDSNRMRRKRKRMEMNKSNNSSTVHTRRREQSHLLLVGDPGCGKSQFLRFATALCPRSVLASGSGTTSAGLTCAAVREDSSKEWTLEAGALVLADRGLCAIDEFSCINPKDRTTIHEAMEQQTLSVAKAGIVAKLNCRATVIAVTNAKSGYYDHNKSFSVNVGIEPPLLSRFDLIFKLIDGSDVNKDDNIATFLLNRAIQGSGYDCTNSLSRSLGKRDVWGIEKLRAYVATVKSRFRPSLSAEASTLLERHYSACRASVDMAIQITVRFLESLIRLAQAHASLMHRSVVQLDDAIAIIILMESSVASVTQNNYNNSLGGDPMSDFPDDDYADFDFLMSKVRICENYNMQEFISQEEYRIIQNERNKAAINEPMKDSWDNYQNSSQPFQEVDHYGRFTQQKTTPSPPKFHDLELTFEDSSVHEEKFSSRKPPSFSAD